MKINILGQEYEILKGSNKDYPKLKSASAMGLAELYSKKLIINTDASTVDDETHEMLEEYEKKVIRHEVMHAFFHESGATVLGQDEDLVEWLAQMLPKITKTMASSGLL